MAADNNTAWWQGLVGGLIFLIVTVFPLHFILSLLVVMMDASIPERLRSPFNRWNVLRVILLSPVVWLPDGVSDHVNFMILLVLNSMIWTLAILGCTIIWRARRASRRGFPVIDAGGDIVTPK